MATSSEPIAPIDGAEAVGIRAYSVNSGVNIRRASYGRERLFRVAKRLVVSSEVETSRCITGNFFATRFLDFARNDIDDAR